MTLICLDLETTGLDPQVDLILEIGMIAIDESTFRETASYSAVVRPLSWDSLRKTLHPKVREMHEASGLYAAVEGEGVPLADAVDRAVAFYDKHAFGERSPLMGANPDFDRGFLRVDARQLERKFHYRNFDTNAFWLLREMLVGRDAAGTKPAAPHRALGDCRLALRTVHEHFEWMRSLYGAESAGLKAKLAEVNKLVDHYVAQGL